MYFDIFYSDSLRLETEMSWSFEELKNRLVNKMSYLVVVNVKRYLKNDIYYYKYYNPTFYTLKNFSNFLWLVEKGLVCVSFKLTYVHYGERFGDFFDKGTGFELDYDHITSLFDIVDLGISF